MYVHGQISWLLAVLVGVHATWEVVHPTATDQGKPLRSYKEEDDCPGRAVQKGESVGGTVVLRNTSMITLRTAPWGI